MMEGYFVYAVYYTGERRPWAFFLPEQYKELLDTNPQPWGNWEGVPTHWTLDEGRLPDA